MEEQPMPKSGGRPVPPEALRRFNEMLPQRDEKGVATYGMSLHTNNGRRPIRDLLEELIDAWQYAVQIEMETEDAARMPDGPYDDDGDFADPVLLLLATLQAYADPGHWWQADYEDQEPSPFAGMNRKIWAWDDSTLPWSRAEKALVKARARLAHQRTLPRDVRETLEVAGRELVGFSEYFRRMGSLGTVKQIDRNIAMIDQMLLKYKRQGETS